MDLEAIQDALYTFVWDFYKDHELNKFRHDETKQFFDAPLIGYAAGDDPMFERFKETVGPFLLTPQEAWATIRPDEEVPEQLTAISILLPQTKAVRDTNRNQKREDPIPSYDWIDAKLRGRQLQVAISAAIVAFLKEHGIDSFATDVTSLIKPTFRSDPFRVEVPWSERHLAYAAGLGTFGLAGNIITEQGTAVRMASVIAATALPATLRPYAHYMEYCLGSGGKCRACIDRCPVSALAEGGKNVELCKERIIDRGKPLVKEKYDLVEQGCGFCQVDVPCEAGVPGKR